MNTIKWMLAAILICGMGAFTACTSDNGDNPVAPQPEKKQFQLAHYLHFNDSGAGVSTDYTYTMADGHITKMVEEGTVKVTAGSLVVDGPSKKNHTYVWEEKKF